MSALAVYLERAGIATTLIGLVRLHIEKVRPPRALWVPFELGRPLGPPNDAAFQTRVLRRALALLGRDDGPRLLDDFAEDDPTAHPDPDWRPPPLPDGALTAVQELDALRPVYQRARAARGFSTVGVSGVDSDSAIAYLQRYDGGRVEKPDTPLSALALLRFACDDVKAFYLEAAAAPALQTPARPSSGQLCDWFWGHTEAAALIYRLRERLLDDADAKTRLVGNSLVPRAQL